MVTAARGRNDASKFSKNLEGDISLAVRRDLLEHTERYPHDTQADVCESVGLKYGRLNAALNEHSPWSADAIVRLATGGFYGGIRAACIRSGGTFVLTPRVDQSPGLAMLGRAFLKMMKKVHTAVEVCFAAIDDGVLLESERDRCVAAIDRAIADFDAARQRLMEAPVQKEIAHV